MRYCRRSSGRSAFSFFRRQEQIEIRTRYGVCANHPWKLYMENGKSKSLSRVLKAAANDCYVREGRKHFREVQAPVETEGPSNLLREKMNFYSKNDKKLRYECLNVENICLE